MSKKQPKKITSSKTEKTIAMLFTGKNKIAKKYAGKHVLVVKDKVIPMRIGDDFWQDFNDLKKEYGETPVTLFVPRRDVSYILLISCK